MAVSHQIYWISFILKRKLHWAYFLNAGQHIIQYISNNILTIRNKMADLTDSVNRKCFLHICKHRTLVTNKVRICSVNLDSFARTDLSKRSEHNLPKLCPEKRRERTSLITHDPNYTPLLTFEQFERCQPKKLKKIKSPWKANQGVTFFRWFKFTLKPPYRIMIGNFFWPIWDTSHWHFFVKFGLKTAWDIS